MGNTAFIKARAKNIGVYLHWNGGIDSVEAFLEYCKMKGYRSFDDSYGLARFCQVVGNFFGGSCSLGIETMVHPTEDIASGYDNGIYEVEGWEIVNRISAPQGREGYDRKEMLIGIDEAQPTNEQFGKDYFEAETIVVENLKIGDRVYVFDNLECKPEIHEVVGFGEDKFCNGTNVLGMPYVDKYLNDGTYANNINNYITEKTIKVLKK